MMHNTSTYYVSSCRTLLVSDTLRHLPETSWVIFVIPENLEMHFDSKFPKTFVDFLCFYMFVNQSRITS